MDFYKSAIANSRKTTDHFDLNYNNMPLTVALRTTGYKQAKFIWIFCSKRMDLQHSCMTKNRASWFYSFVKSLSHTAIDVSKIDFRNLNVGMSFIKPLLFGDKCLHVWWRCFYCRPAFLFGQLQKFCFSLHMWRTGTIQAHYYMNSWLNKSDNF